VIDNNLLRETSFNNNSVSTSPLRELSQDNIQERRYQKRREKEVLKLSKKLKDQDMRSLTVTSNNKRIEYFPEENIIIKGSGLATDL
jgi:sialic acid synthase SpsE